MVTQSGGKEPVTDTAMGLSRTSRLPIAESTSIGDEYPGVAVFLTSSNGSRGNDIQITEWDMVVEEGWGLAVFEGFRHKYDGNQKVYAPTSFTCASANCTYEIFDSLAICNECHDVSEHITSEPFSDHRGEQLVYVLGRQKLGESAVSLSSLKGKLSQGTATSLESAFMHTDGKVRADRRDTFHFRDDFTTFIVFQILKAPRNYASQQSTWEDEPPEAWECGFSFCINRCNSTVQDGILYETVLSSAKQASPGSLTALPRRHSGNMKNITNGTAQWDFWSYPQNYTLYGPLGSEAVNLSNTEGSKWDESKLWDFSRNHLELQIPDDWPNLTYADINYSSSSFNSSGHHAPNIGNMNVPRTLTITAQSVRSTIYWFLDQFTLFGGESRNLHYSGVVTDNNDVARSIARSDNVPETFENAAKRMTAFLREHPQAGREQIYVNGQAFVWVQHIRIRWPFIAFPVAVAVAGLVFVLLTTWETKRLGLRAWKEGALPVLIHGLDPSTRTKLRNADSAGVAKKVSKQTVVSLSRDSAGGSFELKESKESALSTGALLDSYATSSETLTNRTSDGRGGIWS